METQLIWSQIFSVTVFSPEMDRTHTHSLFLSQSQRGGGPLKNEACILRAYCFYYLFIFQETFHFLLGLIKTKNTTECQV